MEGVIGVEEGVVVEVAEVVVGVGMGIKNIVGVEPPVGINIKIVM